MIIVLLKLACTKHLALIENKSEEEENIIETTNAENEQTTNDSILNMETDADVTIVTKQPTMMGRIKNYLANPKTLEAVEGKIR